MDIASQRCEGKAGDDCCPFAPIPFVMIGDVLDVDAGDESVEVNDALGDFVFVP